MVSKKDVKCAKSSDSECAVLTPEHRCFISLFIYLRRSCCDRLQGSISVSHSCSCVQTAPSTRVHLGRLKKHQTTAFFSSQITDTSISAAATTQKRPTGTNVQSNQPAEPHRCILLHNTEGGRLSHSREPIKPVCPRRSGSLTY